MLAMGFSVNLLTLFGLVLSIGIVVDNAIIAMENVERLMRERSLKAREASIETMKQVAGAVLASTLVLVAVFAPSATGQCQDHPGNGHTQLPDGSGPGKGQGHGGSDQPGI